LALHEPFEEISDGQEDSELPNFIHAQVCQKSK